MKKVWNYWMICLLFTLACVLVNGLFFRISNIIPIEFAPTPEHMHLYISQIGRSSDFNYHILKTNTLVDYGFLIGYTLLTIFSFKILLDVFGARMNIWIYLLAIMPGLLDAVENVFLLITARQQSEEFSCFFYYVVRVKWAFAIIPFIIIPIIFLYGSAVLLRAKQID